MTLARVHFLTWRFSRQEWRVRIVGRKPRFGMVSMNTATTYRSKALNEIYKT